MTANKKTVMIVEDDVFIAMMQTQELEQFGYNVFYKNSGEEAIEEVSRRNSEIDLILMDIDLGHNRMTGVDTAKIILKDYEVPVVFMSSHLEPEIIRETEKITSYGYVYKNAPTIIKDTSIKVAFKLYEKVLEVRHSEKKFREVFLLNPAAISINNPKDGFAFIDCNPAFEKITGYKKSEIIGKNANDLGFYGDPNEQEELSRQLKISGEIEDFKHIFKNRNGRKYWTYLNIKKIYIDKQMFYMVHQIDYTDHICTE